MRLAATKWILFGIGSISSHLHPDFDSDLSDHPPSRVTKKGKRMRRLPTRRSPRLQTKVVEAEADGPRAGPSLRSPRQEAGQDGSDPDSDSTG